MPTVKFNTADEVSNVMEQMPPEAQAPNSGFAAKELDNGKWELTVPDKWAGAVKGANPHRRSPAPPRAIPKSVVMTRLVEAGKFNDAFAALWGNPVHFTKWFSPDRPTVDSRDPDMIALLESLDVDPDAILAKP